ncbi:hypothetical protein IF1G_04984 [Cordyceps javanica]|uniref:Uncharacterized protein n=1 Tax=Cordyceps javanica TaxID=43265 RepID=A0A545V3W3_9HYPO|nr:hypothetical protein IF1G_04984 [Cordyceps javanica]
MGSYAGVKRHTPTSLLRRDGRRSGRICRLRPTRLSAEATLAPDEVSGQIILARLLGTQKQGYTNLAPER